MCYDLRGLEQVNYVKVLLVGIFSEKASLGLISVAKANCKIVFTISSFQVTFASMSKFCKWIEEAGVWSLEIK